MSRPLHEHRRRRVPRLGFALLCSLTACRQEVAPTWIPLARGFAPAAGVELARTWDSGPISARPVDEGRALWLGTALAAEAWHANTAAGAAVHEWWAARPLPHTFQNRGEEELALELDGDSVASAPDRTRAEPRAGAGEAVFFPEGPRLVLLRSSAEPPGPARFSCRVERGRQEDGVWRATLQGLVADGLSIWPGESWATELEIPPASALRFATVARDLGRPGHVVFRVVRDGETLLEHAETLAGNELGSWHELPLAAGTARLTFEVRGDPGLTAFVHPRIGPLAVGAPGARPWRDARPNVVLFLADTFRSDLLATGGGAAEIAPNLNRLAERSLRFLRVRSPATWTLPAQSSLFTGLFPTQHGALHDGQTFSPELLTLTERLARAGYRTGAVTDAGYVSRQYGLDQGFEWFLEHPESAEQRLAQTLAAAREFLARDDGRPVFLFVHTYRVHWPYRTGPAEDRRAHDALVARFSADLAPGKAPEPARLQAFAEELAALYRQGAHGLDELVGPWLDELEQAGFFRQGYFVFTSDHGEAFFEHGKSEHGGPPFEEELRVPLLLAGPGLESRSSLAGVSLVDLTPTLAELCGIPADPLWCGRSLLAPLGEELTFAWHGEHEKSSLAIVSGAHKLLMPAALEALERGEVKAAFALDLDPGERENVIKLGAPWPAELARSAAARWEQLSRLQAESEEVEISTWLKEELGKLGYGGQ